MRTFVLKRSENKSPPPTHKNTRWNKIWNLGQPSSTQTREKKENKKPRKERSDLFKHSFAVSHIFIRVARWYFVSNQKSQFGKILVGLRMEKVGVYHGHLYIPWYILWPFGNLVAIWSLFHRFDTLCQEKSGNPG
jgi:hypothetical protein